MTSTTISVPSSEYESLSIRFNRLPKSTSDEIQSLLQSYNPIIDIRLLKGPLKTSEQKRQYHKDYYLRTKDEYSRTKDEYSRMRDKNKNTYLNSLYDPLIKDE